VTLARGMWLLICCLSSLPSSVKTENWASSLHWAVYWSSIHIRICLTVWSAVVTMCATCLNNAWLLLFDCFLHIWASCDYRPFQLGSLLQRHGVTSCCGWSRRLPVVESSCEYIELAVAVNKGWSSLGVWAGDLKTKIATWWCQELQTWGRLSGGMKVIRFGIWPGRKEARRGVGVDWINLAWNRDRCRSLVKTELNFRFPNIAPYLLTIWWNVAFSGAAHLPDDKQHTWYSQNKHCLFPTYCLQRCSVFLAAGTAFIYLFI